MPFYQQELTVGADGGEDRLMFIWPTTIVHKIDRHSPLYMLSASDMLKERFEVVCMLGEFFCFAINFSFSKYYFIFMFSKRF